MSTLFGELPTGRLSDDDRPHLLVCAYAFSPVLGSEFAQGWNYVAQMRQRYRLTVLVGSSDGRMGDFTLLQHPDVRALCDEVRIVPVEMDWFCRLIKKLDVKYKLTWLFVYGLRRWHWLAYRKAQSLHAGDPIAGAHQLGPVGFRNPGYLYRLRLPSYWGPIGGFQYINLSLAFQSDFRYGILSVVRNFSTFIAARSLSMGAAMRGFDRVSFATSTNHDNFARRGGQDGPVLSDQGTTRPSTDISPLKSMEGPLQVVWCGSIDGRKNIRMLLDIATSLHKRHANCRITVIGSGGLMPAARALIEERELANVTLTGQISRDVVQDYFRKAHVLSFTSLSEANTATFFEALDAGCIPLALDLDGFSTNISNEIGFKISTSQGWKAIVDEYSQHLYELSKNIDLRKELADGVRRTRGRYNWQELADRHSRIIDTMLASFHERL